MIKLTDSRCGMQNVQTLWESISKLSVHVEYDNRLCESDDNGNYPTHIRVRQLQAIKSLISELEYHHNKQLTKEKNQLNEEQSPPVS